MKLTLAAMILLYAAVLVSLGGGAARADATPAATTSAASSAGCDNSTASKAIMTACQAYVVGVTPMPMWGKDAYDCCMTLRSAPLTCLCSRSLSPYLLQLINLPAVKNMLQTCRIQVPSGYTCGGVKLGD